MARVYVGNLPYSVTEQELQEYFADFGGTNAAIPRDNQGRSKGFGFVDVDDAEAASKAKDGQDMGGRKITVNEARPREDRSEDRGTDKPMMSEPKMAESPAKEDEMEDAMEMDKDDATDDADEKEDEESEDDKVEA